ncbi:MAG: hypothetical protein JWM11_6103 [Planctomycetaceae bacterium]|nr:hypothetical protein [Planctomycetaceae bacterium]
MITDIVTSSGSQKIQKFWDAIQTSNDPDDQILIQNLKNDLHLDDVHLAKLNPPQHGKLISFLEQVASCYYVQVAGSGQSSFLQAFQKASYAEEGLWYCLGPQAAPSTCQMTWVSFAVAREISENPGLENYSQAVPPPIEEQRKQNELSNKSIVRSILKGNNREKSILWLACVDDVTDNEGNFVHFAEICDRLGLSHFRPGMPYLALVIDISKQPILVRVPTCIDSNGGRDFRPATAEWLKSRRTGRTYPLSAARKKLPIDSDDNKGVREVVVWVRERAHPGFLNQHATYFEQVSAYTNENGSIPFFQF